MLKIIFVFFICIFSFSSFSQKSPNSFLISKRKNYFKDGKAIKKHQLTSVFTNGINYGFHGSINSNPNINSSTSNAIYLTTRYFINKNWGINLKLGYDEFQSKTDDFAKSKLALANINLMYDLGDILDFNSVNNNNLKTDKSNFQLYVNLGFGIATFWNENYLNSIKSDPFINNHDDIINWNIGFSPEYKINKKLSVNVDFSLNYNYFQDRTFNYSLINENKVIELYTFTLGFNYFY